MCYLDARVLGHLDADVSLVGWVASLITQLDRERLMHATLIIHGDGLHRKASDITV